MKIPEGAIPQPDLERLPPIQIVTPVCCPYCKSANVRYWGKHNGMRYYRCRNCASTETLDWTTFKVMEEKKR